MKTDIYDARAVYNARRKRRRRKILIRRVCIAVSTIILTVLLVTAILSLCRLFNPTAFDQGFIPQPFGANISKKVEKAKTLELPEWVDVQLIHKHTTARTGINLTDIKNVVVHYVGNANTTAQNNRNYFDRFDTTVSSHFIVGLDGEIIQCVPLFERSAATNNRNKDTISIEVCHPDDTGKYNDKTYEALIKLIVYICNQFSLDENDVIRHYDVTGKICPKYYVENEDEWVKLRKDVGERLN